MAYIPPNPNGQASMANSSPVAIASDQTLPLPTGAATAANQTNGTQQTKLGDGTNLANVLANDTGYNGVPVNNANKILTFTTSSAGVQTLLANTDVRGYAWLAVIYSSVGSGLALTVPFSPNSGGTYIPTQSWEDRGATGSIPGNIGTTVSKIYASPVLGPFMQIAVSALTSGTFSGFVVLSSYPLPFTTVNVAGAATVSVQTISQVPGTGATNLGKAEDAQHASGDVGVMDLGVINQGATTTFSSSNGDYVPSGRDGQGRQYVVQKAPTATLTNVSSSATNVTLLAANDARIGAQFYNDSTQICYLKFGATATSTSFTVPLAAATYYELPGGYTGIIDGIWVSANGSMRVTELT